ncbi:MAG: phosphate acyltransferase PlsX [Polyangia bacterium]|jgi:glycerol-3-phosphate acyltransferase PlsX
MTDPARIRVAVDAMGAEGAPCVEVEGALSALTGPAIDIVLVGDQERVRRVLDEMSPGVPAERIQVRHAAEVVAMDEAPAVAIRQKKASSMRICFEMAKQGEVDAVVSAGNSGAMMAGALLVLGRIAGVERPAIVTTFPTQTGQCALLDMGANVDLRPTVLAQFSVLGSGYARLLHKKERPRVGLLSNGAEGHKGTALTREAHQLLTRAGTSGRTAGFDYLGYVEGRDIFRGQVDVVVTDGFTGNVLLKSCEGLVEWLTQAIRDEVEQGSVLEKLGAFLMRPALRRFRRRSDYAETGGAPLVGVDGVVLICHGSSDARSIKNGVLAASELVRARFREEMARAVTEHAYLWREDVPADGAGGSA